MTLNTAGIRRNNPEPDQERNPVQLALPLPSQDFEQGERPPRPEVSDQTPDEKKTLLDILQEKFTAYPREHNTDFRPPDEDLESAKKHERRRRDIFLNGNRAMLYDYLRNIYIDRLFDLSMLSDRRAVSPEIQSVWSRVDLPDNPAKYLNSLLVSVFGFDLTVLNKLMNDPDQAEYWAELREFELYSSQTEFNRDAQKVYWATCYLFQYADQQYQAEFLDNVCSWWVEHVWTEDPGFRTFVAYSQKHLARPLERPELLELYKEQLRIVIGAQIAPLSSPIKSVVSEVSMFRVICQFNQD